MAGSFVPRIVTIAVGDGDNTETFLERGVLFKDNYAVTVSLDGECFSNRYLFVIQRVQAIVGSDCYWSVGSTTSLHLNACDKGFFEDMFRLSLADFFQKHFLGEFRKVEEKDECDHEWQIYGQGELVIDNRAGYLFRNTLNPKIWRWNGMIFEAEQHVQEHIRAVMAVRHRTEGEVAVGV